MRAGTGGPDLESTRSRCLLHARGDRGTNARRSLQLARGQGVIRARSPMHAGTGAPLRVACMYAPFRTRQLS